MLTALGCVGCGALSLCLVFAGGLGFYASHGASDVTVTSPPGAAKVDVKVVRLSEPKLSIDTNVVLAGPVFSLEAKVSSFDHEVELELPYDPARVPADRVKDLRAAYWTGRSWRDVEGTVDTARHRVKAKTRHLSFWSVKYDHDARVKKRSHPKLPFDVSVVAAYESKVKDETIDAIQSAVVSAWSKLTTRAGATRGFQLAEPPFGDGRRLEILLTNISDKPDVKAAVDPVGGAAALGLEDDLIVMQYDLISPGTTKWNEVVHEFVHVIQHTYRRQSGGDDASWKPWIGEATATFLASAIAPPLDADQIAAGEKNFCYVPLLFHSQLESAPKPVPRDLVTHQYEAQLYIAFVVSKLGPGFLNALFQKAYASKRSEREILEETIHEVSGGKESVGSLYKDFVLAFEYERQLGGWHVYDKKPRVLDPYRAQDLAVPADGKAGTLALDGQELCIPAAVRVSVPKPEAKEKRTLELGLASSAPSTSRWLWAFAKSGSGHRLLGGAADRLSVALDDATEEVVVLPVSLVAQGLTLTAKLGKEEPPPASNLLRLKWTREEKTFSTVLPIYVALEIAGAKDDPAVKKLKDELRTYRWVALRAKVDGKTFHVYTRLNVDIPQLFNTDTWIPVLGKGSKHVVVTLEVAGQTATLEGDFTPDADRFALSERDLASGRQILEESKRELARIEAKRQEGDEDLYSWTRANVAGAHLAIGKAHAELGDLTAARAAWAEADKLTPDYSAHARAQLALSLGEIDAYETHMNATKSKPDYTKLAEAAVLHHDDLERAWKLIDAKKADRTVLFGWIPSRGDKIAH
ncbi:MAG: hypothetical protein ACAI25_14955 [Planctomycetota bacterium]